MLVFFLSSAGNIQKLPAIVAGRLETGRYANKLFLRRTIYLTTRARVAVISSVGNADW